jgi:hypothetical protein
MEESRGRVSAKRIQCKRTKGWRMPDGAILVARPTKWGNPFRVGEPIERDSELWSYMNFLFKLRGTNMDGFASVTPLMVEDVVDCYQRWLADNPPLFLSVQPELAGHDLACWCKPGTPCHADVLLELANA